MNMNKTLLAVALATAGLSANVMALSFSDGNFNGSVDIGGTITVSLATNQWQWAAGEGLDAHKHAVTVMTNNHQTLTIPMAADTPLLVGQTKAATVGAVGGVGLTPQISFMQADGITPAAITWGGTADGKGVMELQVVDGAAPTTALGTADVHVKAGGAKLYSLATGVDPLNDYYLAMASTYGGAGLFGASAIPPAYADAIPSSDAYPWIEALGATRTQLAQAQDVIALSGYPTTTPSLYPTFPSTSFDMPSAIYTGAYGLGIAAGDEIVVNFDAPVATETQWKAPLNIAVTYF